MKLLDLERKGNVVRFFLGADDLEKWWGDDWDDAPKLAEYDPYWKKCIIVTVGN